MDLSDPCPLPSMEADSRVSRPDIVDVQCDYCSDRRLCASPLWDHWKRAAGELKPLDRAIQNARRDSDAMQKHVQACHLRRKEFLADAFDACAARCLDPQSMREAKDESMAAYREARNAQERAQQCAREAAKALSDAEAQRGKCLERYQNGAKEYYATLCSER